MSKLAQIKQAQIDGGENPYVGVDPGAGDDRTAEWIAPNDALADYQLAMQIDLAKVAAAPNVDDKIRIKRALLSTYINFVDKYMESGANYPNDVAVQVMIWQLDCGEITHGLNLALTLAKQNQRMPKKFDRDMKTFLCDFFYDWANVQMSAGVGISPTLDVLVAAAEQDKWDVHPLCISKIMVILAKYKNVIGEYKIALDLCNRAEAANPKAGVKKLIAELEKSIQGQKSDE